MKQLTILLLILLNFNAFAEVNLDDYTAIPMREKVDGRDSPGFYMNLPHEVDSFGNWGDYWRTAQIIDISSTAYTLGDKVAPFIRIRTGNGDQPWVFGGDVIIVSTDTETKKGWYYNPDSGHKHMQIFYIDDQFHFVTSDNSRVKYNPETGTSDKPNNFTVKSTSGWTSVFQWDKSEGNFFYGSKRPGNENNEEYDYESNYAFNLDLLEVEKVFQVEDEWFWHFYNEKDYDSILDLKARGYEKYNYSKSSSPFFKSIADRDREMIEFLINNGFSQTVDGGNYDAQISCLWDLIRNDDYEMIEFLLDAGVEKNTGGELGISWDLNYVIRYSTPEMLQLFINGGYDATHPTYGYSNGEDSGGSGSFLFSAVYKDNIEMAEILIENGANVNFLSQQYGFGKFSSRTPLDAAASPQMKELLIAHGALSSDNLTLEDYRKQGLGLTGKMNDTKVRYREKPGTEENILGLIDDNEDLIVINSFGPPKEDSASRPWYLVRRNNGEFGWVYGEFVDVSRGFIKY